MIATRSTAQNDEPSVLNTNVDEEHRKRTRKRAKILSLGESNPALSRDRGRCYRYTKEDKPAVIETKQLLLIMLDPLPSESSFVAQLCSNSVSEVYNELDGLPCHSYRVNFYSISFNTNLNCIILVDLYLCNVRSADSPSLSTMPRRVNPRAKSPLTWKSPVLSS